MTFYINDALVSNLVFKMPYEKRTVGKGMYKVCKKNTKQCFSKKGLSASQATKQQAAIAISKLHSKNKK